LRFRVYEWECDDTLTGKAGKNLVLDLTVAHFLDPIASRRFLQHMARLVEVYSGAFEPEWFTAPQDSTDWTPMDLEPRTGAEMGDDSWEIVARRMEPAKRFKCQGESEIILDID
jgi:hypothetical protein